MPDPIKVMQNEMACVNRQITGCDRDCIKCDLVLEDSEIIAAYEAAIEALEKQKPQKPNSSNYFSRSGRCLCPRCNHWIDSELAFEVDAINYCPVCGQALDWSEEKK